MAFQPVPDTASLQFRFLGASNSQFPGLPWFFSLYVRDEVVGWTQTMLNLLAGYGVNWWDTGKNGGAALRTVCVNDWELQEVTARDLGAENGLSAEALPVNPTGTKTGDPMPPSVPMVIQLPGDVGGLPKRGRIFWSGGDELDCTGDDWLLAYRNSVAGRFTDFRTDLNDIAAGGNADWAQVIVSRNAGTQVDPSPPRIPVRRATAVTNTLGGPITARSVVGALRNRRTAV